MRRRSWPALAAVFCIAGMEHAASLQLQSGAADLIGIIQRPKMSSKPIHAWALNEEAAAGADRAGARKGGHHAMHWHTSPGSESCADACEARGMACSESALEAVDNPAAVAAVARKAGRPCEETGAYVANDFPSQTVDGMCSYSRRDYRPTCGVSTFSVVRYCPCHVPKHEVHHHAPAQTE
mmetsp:Transcript_51997/g.146535  ORF Transcript_51997/g.146535 Transcript_51997/m.146535 type:complete len:181 (+) Transcript_51997:57-599(+)